MAEFTMGASLTMTNNFSAPMSAATQSAEQFKQTLNGTDQAIGNLNKGLGNVHGKGLQELTTSATQAATAANSVVAPVDGIVTSTNRAQNAIQSFNRGWQSIKQLPTTLHNIGSTLKTNVANGFTSAKLQASLFVASVKAVGKQKFTGMVNSLKQLKSTLTEGQTGVKGFATSLKNIGKISIASTVNAVRSLTQNMKEFAKVKISGISDKLKGLKNSFTDGKTGASGLLAALKKVAGVSFNALHSGLSKIGSVASKAGKAVASGLGNAVKTTAKGLGVAAAAGATAVTALVTSSVKSYGDYEQLVGGVETLFGAGGQSLEEYAQGVGKSVDKASSEYNKLMASQQTVLTNANNAYKTAGLSANDYMETVTSFSASLLQSLGGDTQKAASVADRAIIDMADNANKMGTGMDMIQNAYQGFAKQNYTMLDNLKLGYGGTKTEMERLLKDASKLSGQKFDISSYADIIEAIHVVQENMGITGTTAKEASMTIQGSASAMKAAWGNMLVALTTGGDDFNRCLDALVDTALTFGKNVIPVVQKALTGVSKLIEGLAPVIAQVLPELLNSVLPGLLSAATSIIDSLVTALPGLISTITPSLVSGVIQIFTSLAPCIPQVLLTGLDLILGLAQGITQGLPQILQVATQSITTFVQGIASRVPDIMNTATQLLLALAQGITQNLPTLIQTGLQAVVSFIQGIVSNLPALLSAAMQCVMSLVQGIISSLPQILQAGVQVITSLVQGIVTMLPMLIQYGIQLIVTLIQGIIQNLPAILQAAVQIVVTLAGGLIQAIPQLVAAIPQLVSAIIDTILSTNWLDVGWQIVKGIGSGLVDGIKGIFGGGGKEGGTSLTEGAASGITSNLGTVSTATSQISTTMSQGLQASTTDFNTFGANATTSIATGITTNAGAVYDSASALGPGIATSLTTSLSTVDTSAATSALGTNITNGVTTGIQTGTGTVVAAATDMTSQAQAAVDSGMANISASFGTLDVSGITAKCAEITQAFTEGMANANNAVTAGIATITSTLNSCNLYSCGVSIMQGLNNGMQSMRGSIMATAQSIANSVKSTINSALDIHSPSRVLFESGENTGEGFANGLLSLINKVKANAQTIADTAVEPFSSHGTAGDISASGTITSNKSRSGGGLKIMIDNLILQDVGNKNPKQLVKEILTELYTQLGGDNELLSDVDMGVLL